MLLEDPAALLDVVGDGVAAERNHGRVADDALLENGNVGGAAADVDERHAGLLLFFAQDGGAGGDGLEDELIDLQAGPLDAAVDVLGRGRLSGDDVEVGFEAHAGVADGLLDAGLAVHGELLRQHVEDLLPRQHLELLHVLDELLDVLPVDFLLRLGPDQLSPMLQALNVLPRNAHVDHLDAHVGGLLGGFHGGPDGLDGLLDVGHHAAGHPDGFTPAIPDDLQLAMGILLAHDAGDFGGSDVESDDDVLGGMVLVHGRGDGIICWPRAVRRSGGPGCRIGAGLHCRAGRGRRF